MRRAAVALVALMLIGCGSSAPASPTPNVHTLPLSQLTGAQWPALSPSEQEALVSVPIVVRPHCPNGVTIPVIVRQVSDAALQQPQAMAADLANAIVYADGCR